MISKKAQATIFIVLGIVIVIALGLLYYVRSEQIKSYFGIEEKIDPSLEPLRWLVQGCMEDIGDDGIELIGLQGGKIYLREGGYLNTNNGKISYLARHAEDVELKQEEIERELSIFMKDHLRKCVMDFNTSDYPAKGGAIDESAVEIKENSVVFDVKWPVALTKDGKNYKENNFKYKTPEKNTDYKNVTRLGKIVDMVNRLSGNKCLTKDLSEKLLDENPDARIYYFDYDESAVYTIEDNGYLFRFALERCMTEKP